MSDYRIIDKTGWFIQNMSSKVGKKRGAAAHDLLEFLHLLHGDIDFDPGLDCEASKDGIRFLRQLERLAPTTPPPANGARRSD